MNIIGVVDCETTGEDPSEHRLVELAVVVVEPLRIKQVFSSLVDPGRPIPPEATAVHHITEEMIRSSDHVEWSFTRDLITQMDNEYVTHWCAHNAEFDRHHLIATWKPWICTFRCARHLWPHAPNHKLQTLRYWLELPCNPRGVPHRAAYDAEVTAHLLVRMMAERTPEELVELTNAPILLQTVAFGKHKGELWAEVPKDYLRWVLRQNDFDPDTTHTARHHLQ